MDNSTRDDQTTDLLRQEVDVLAAEVAELRREAEDLRDVLEARTAP